MSREQERTDEFERELGRARASRLQQLSQNSTTSGWGLQRISADQVFREKAIAEGYTEKELALFDML